MDPTRVVAELVVLAPAAVTIALPERVLRYAEGRQLVRSASTVPSGALVTAFLGVALVVGL